MSPADAPRRIALTEERTRLGGVATRRLAVDGEGPPFLLLHGFADSADTWRPLLELLGAAGRRAVAIDLAGFGVAGRLDSTSPLLGQWDRMVNQAVRELCEAQEHEAGVYVVGNSLGGCLAMRSAERHELPIAGVVPIAPAGLEMARWLAIIEREWLIRVLRHSPVPLPVPLVRQVVGRVYAGLAFSTAGRASPDVVESFSGHIPTVERAGEILDIGRQMLAELVRPYRLERITCPLLLVWGDRDRMVYTGGAERVLRTVPYSDIEVIPDCGHCPQVERPERTAQILLEFPGAYEHPSEAVI